MEEMLAGSPQELKPFLNTLFEGAYLVDADRRILAWNRAAERITGFKASEVVGLRCSDNVLSHVDEEGESLCLGRCPVADSITTGKPGTARVFIHHSSGHRVPVAIRVLPVETPEGRVALELFREDMALHTMRERLRDLETMALVDPLTGMGNRRLASQTITQRIAERERYGRLFGLVLVDIDEFKPINDTWGHDAGDEVLAVVARSLLGVVRPFDVVCRWGGDEFLAVVQNVDSRSLTSVAERMRGIVESSSVEYDNRSISATVSVGGALSRRGEPADGMLVRVDALLYEAKEAGRNRTRID